MTNLFENFRDYQTRKVDNPNYTPLGQPILEQTPTKEEVSKAKHSEYHKNYYEKNKEKIKEYNRNYWRKKHASSNPKDELSWFQKKVYDYLLNQYRKWEEPARWTQIAKALGISENSVYTAVFQLTKKWYLGRWTYGKYLLIKFPDGDTTVNETPVEKEPEMVYVEENNYDSMVEKIKSLEEQVSNSVWHIEWLMNSNAELEKKNIDLLHQIEELKLLIKLLYKYFGNV